MVEKSTWLPDQDPGGTRGENSSSFGNTESSSIGWMLSGCALLLLMVVGLGYALVSCVADDSESETTTTVTQTETFMESTPTSLEEEGGRGESANSGENGDVGDIPEDASPEEEEVADHAYVPAVQVTEDVVYNRCRDFIEKDLKSPTSADFAPRREWVFVPVDGGIGAGAYVDADNSFGAHIRKEFMCTVKSIEGDDTNVMVDAVWVK